MMKQLIRKVQAQDIHIFYGTELTDFSSSNGSVHLKTKYFECKAGALFIATNGFSKSLQIEDVSPARAQVLITKPIENLHIKGAFHLDMGYYYFRNIDQRILLGGGRNLAFKEEETTDFSQTSLIQDALDRLLKETILPGVSFEIDHRWSGIMGVGAGKEPLLKCVQPNVYCGVRLGGMGVALGSKVGNELAELHC
jgi:glycine/D-amino acid oxidase-like deaminating enzyme